MSDFVQIFDVGDKAVDLLIPEYQETPRVQALLRAMIEPQQEIEQCFDDLSVFLFNLDLSDMEFQANATIDIAGVIVGELRDGRDNEEYERAIKVRVLVNRSHGSVEELIAIAALFTGVDP